ncbi:hypothetical protein KIP69_14440 [Geobacter sulfurreducens]|jgi:hypothetical protein|uniref:Uncharacterized protein n=1 Tax=Geobacter sulfurreducens (strain ATCC 51573 / DSM 12127 / PCA) TaxID=243231 RepID=Q748N3_GEOSL|nr:hypothetical protein [Geobacter sulfurreducens]BET59351.1 hypothetical protein GEO60473_23910 [Geobacter sp. 60473]AAR36360.1 hypothetical protein GSU2968 [Geobacter sulfurreducens PCA]ADI85723.1 hypothetical protein KN400_2911 [Geobacter sulfurreducens KN400]AJY69221.1 hypothetical protein RW64_06185 [Geobacter sulfurreducens]QVW34779.1 hypothetical protein KIP69_14440 [Geobacter sulfurreducens]
MKVLGLTFAVMLLALLVVLSVLAHAAAPVPPEPEDPGMLAGALLGFASFVVATKLIPGIIRFASIIDEETVSPNHAAIAETGDGGT